MRCRTARRWITTDLAGELSSGRAGRLERHVEQCGDCRREQTAFIALDRALREMPMESRLPPWLEQNTLRRVRLARAADDPPGPWPVWRWVGLTVPALGAVAVAVLAVRMTTPPEEPSAASADAGRAVTSVAARGAGQAPAPERTASRRRSTPRVPSDPPPELAARPDLFINLPMLRSMEKVQHFESIEMTTLDGQDDDQSNG